MALLTKTLVTLLVIVAATVIISADNNGYCPDGPLGKQ